MLALMLAATVASADGVAIRYQAEGQGEPALVFVHGWCCNRHHWDAQMAAFAKAHRVVALDLAGHGESGRDRKQWSVPAFADDVKAVVEAEGLKRVVLIGHSMGGSVVVEASRRMPGRVAALVPVDIFVNVERKLTPAERRAFIEYLRKDFPASMKEFVGQGLFIPTSPKAVVDRVVAEMAAASPEMALLAMQGIWDYDVPAALKQLSVPIRCINSDRRPTDLEAARRYAPRFEVAVMKGVGHFPMLEEPAGFNQLLEQAIEELVPAPPVK